MRSLKRVYSTVAEVVCGVLVAVGLLGLAAAWIAPRWARDAARGIAQLVSESQGWQLATQGATPAPPPEAASQGAPPPVSPQPEPVSRIDPASLEARLRLLQGPPLGAPGLLAASERSAMELRVWETLREPLNRLLRNEMEAPGAVASPGTEMPIQTLAPRVLAYLERLESERHQAAERLLKTLDPASLARMLADEEGLSPGQAQQVLRRLSPAAAAQLIDKLSRLAPAQAARLLEAVFPATTGGLPHLTRGRESHG